MLRGVKMNLGQIVKQYRIANNLTMEDFAKMSKLSKGYISMLEKNINPKTKKEIVPTFSTIKLIAKAMSLDVNNVISALDENQPIIWGEFETSSKDKNKTDNFIKTFEQLSDVGKEKVIDYTNMVYTSEQNEK